jgi:hypothetical protein
VSLLATAQLVKKALGSNPAFLQGVENILFLLIQGTVRLPGVLLNSRMRTGSLAQLFFVSDVCRVKQCYGSGMFIPDPGSRIPDLGPRISDLGSGSRISGSQIADPGSRIPDLGSRIPDRRSRIRISVSRIPDPTTTKEVEGEKIVALWVPFCGQKHSKLKIFHFLTGTYRNKVFVN